MSMVGEEVKQSEEKDLEKAKTYYALAYKEGHGLARKKLKEWNFLD